MRHPSIRLRLILGTGVAVAVVLLVANVLIYRAIRRTLEKEIRVQLLQSASLLSKSSELESTGVVYEWHEALESGRVPDVTGMFQFWDVNTRHTVRSPALREAELPYFHGEMNRPVLRSITLADGRPALAVGLLHCPFRDNETLEEMKRRNELLSPSDFPQVLVCAQETRTLDEHLERMSGHLLKAGVATLVVIWLSVLGISARTLRPIRDLTSTLLRRSTEEATPLPDIPAKLPKELTGLAHAFNTTLMRVEAARAREREFALRAAHELRTPVAGIQAILEQALHRPREAADLQVRIGKALGLTQDMRVTLDGLMRLARLRGGVEAVASDTFDPLACLRATWSDFHPLAASRDLKWEFDGPQAVRCLASDIGLFRVLATNLVENAARHTPRGGMAKMQVTDSPTEFGFSITNDRGALQPEDAACLFEPFARGPANDADETPHAGLGLSLGREIAVLLGGRLGLAFDDERTVTFRVVIPR